jgi:hypothetical protein
MESGIQGRVRQLTRSPASRIGNQALEIIADDSRSHFSASWLERADLVGQVWGSSPHGPTILVRLGVQDQKTSRLSPVPVPGSRVILPAIPIRSTTARKTATTGVTLCFSWTVSIRLEMRTFPLRAAISAVFAFALLCLATDDYTQGVRQPTSAQEQSLKAFLQDYLRDPSYNYRATRCFSAFVDLKDDGTQQVIVYFTDEHSCGSGGCTTLILTSERSSYKLVTSITIAWPPIRILNTESHGWRDIAVEVHGGGEAHPYYAKLSFDGKTYPSNPTVPPAMPLSQNPGGTVVVPLSVHGRPL